MLVPDKPSACCDCIADPVFTRIPRPHPLLAPKGINPARVELLALYG
jgi:hypothetical protein